MSRSIVLACLCALPLAGLIRQDETARTLAATLDEGNRPGPAIDPIDPPRDSLTDSLVRTGRPLEPTRSPSAPDGPLPLTRLGRPSSPAGGPIREAAIRTTPAASMLRRLSRLQVFRN